MRVPIVCTVHVRIQLTACTTITIRTVTYATYVEYVCRAGVRAHAFIYGRYRESEGQMQQYGGIVPVYNDNVYRATVAVVFTFATFAV